MPAVALLVPFDVVGRLPLGVVVVGGEHARHPGVELGQPVQLDEVGVVAAARNGCWSERAEQDPDPGPAALRERDEVGVGPALAVPAERPVDRRAPAMRLRAAGEKRWPASGSPPSQVRPRTRQDYAQVGGHHDRRSGRRRRRVDEGLGVAEEVEFFGDSDPPVRLPAPPGRPEPQPARRRDLLADPDRLRRQLPARGRAGSPAGRGRRVPSSASTPGASATATATGST